MLRFGYHDLNCFLTRADGLISVAPFGAYREKAFLCANSVVLGVSVVELLEKTLTTEAQRSHRGPQRRILRQAPEQAIA